MTRLQKKADWSLLEREFEEAGRSAVYIRKPVANAEGRGIHLVGVDPSLLVSHSVSRGFEARERIRV